MEHPALKMKITDKDSLIEAQYSVLLKVEELNYLSNNEHSCIERNKIKELAFAALISMNAEGIFQKEENIFFRNILMPTPIKNAFNSKTAYWLSKANCTVSIYMFTCENGYNEKEMFSDMNMSTYIAMLEEKCKRAHDHVIYMEEYRAAKEYLKKRKKKETAQKELQKCGRKYNTKHN